MTDKSITVHNVDKNELIIDNSNNDVPLKIILKGKINIEISDDLLIETNNQLDVVSYGKPICIDTVNSKLYLNSRKAKKLNDVLEEYKPVLNYTIHDDVNYLKLKVLELENLIHEGVHDEHK